MEESKSDTKSTSNRTLKTTRTCQICSPVDWLHVRSIAPATTSTISYARNEFNSLLILQCQLVSRAVDRSPHPIDRQVCFLLVHVVHARRAITVLLATTFVAHADCLRCSSFGHIQLVKKLHPLFPLPRYCLHSMCFPQCFLVCAHDGTVLVQ